MNGEALPGFGALAEEVGALGAGSIVTLKIQRDGLEFLQSLQLGVPPLIAGSCLLHGSPDPGPCTEVLRSRPLRSG